MKAEQTLKMLEENRIEELTQMLRNEIFENSLKASTGQRQRLSAMKKYFEYGDKDVYNPVFQKPSTLVFEGKGMTALTNGQSAIITNETCGPTDRIPPEQYVKLQNFIVRRGKAVSIDIGKAIAVAKSLGYKISKKEVHGSRDEFKYAFYYDGAYYKVGLVDATYAVLDAGTKCMVYHEEDQEKQPIVIENEIGIAIILPFHYNGDGLLHVIDLVTAEEM